MVKKSTSGFAAAWTRQSFPVLLIIVLVFLAVVVWAGARVFGYNRNDSAFSVVSMTNGDIYFGRLGWFPQPHLSNAWVLQRYTDAKGGTQLAISPVTKALWSPSDTIYLSKSNMISWARLQKDSQMAAALANPNAVPVGVGPAEQAPAAGSSTSTGAR